MCIRDSHRWDATYHEWKKKQKESSNNNNNNNNRNRNNDKDNEELTPADLSFAQLSFCYKCGDPSHKVPQCPLGDIPKSEWAINKMAANHVKSYKQSHAQQESSEEKEQAPPSTATTGQSSRTPSRDEMTMHIETSAHAINNIQRVANSRNQIIFDTGSTINVFCNRNLVKNIRLAPHPIHMHTNAGVCEVNQVADFEGLGTVWFTEKAITNIVGANSIVDTHNFWYDDSTRAFVLSNKKTGRKSYFIHSNKMGLWIKTSTKPTSHAIQTVPKNKEGFTKKQILRATIARALQHNLSFPTVENFKAIVQANGIRNCPITVEDIANAEKIFGPSVSGLKGKTKRRKPKAAEETFVPIPKELLKNNQQLDLCVDVMKIGGLRFLTSIDKTIGYRSAVYIKNEEFDTILKAMKMIINEYNQGSFRIQRIFGDGAFECLRSTLATMGIKLDVCGAQDHVPEIERSIETIKERYRVTVHRLPFDPITHEMTKHGVIKDTRNLNAFPAKNGISDHYSPHVMITRQALDYDRHFKYEFGSFVQVNQHNDKQHNTMEPRTLDAIYLRPCTGATVGHYVLDLQTNRRITRSRVIPIPMTQAHIDRVEAIALDEGMKPLRMKNRNGIFLPDNDLIAGVEGDCLLYTSPSPRDLSTSRMPSSA